MTQTVKDNKDNVQRRTRPGQRQRERQVRIARRRRRRQIFMGTSIALIFIALVGLGFWEYSQVTGQQQVAAQKVKDQQATSTAKVKNQQATATEKVAAPTQTVAANVAATAVVHATATAVQSTIDATKLTWLTVTAGTPMPTTGLAAPPTVSGNLVTIANGVKYIDVKTGTGTGAVSGSTVSVEYTGWLAKTGKKFDSSFDHGGQSFPLQLGQGQVIPGWDAGLVGIKAGGMRRLYIPAAQAYGAAGSSTVIPPNADLIFDVTVLSVQ